MNALLTNIAIILGIAAILQAIAQAIANAAGYIRVRTQLAEQGAKLRQVAEQAQHTQDTVAATPAMVVAPIAGGGAGPRLLDVDPVRQGAGVSVSAAPAWTGDVDCGLACVVSEIANIKGTWSADELLRLRYFGVVDRRLTTPDDIVGMLRANDIPAHKRRVDAATARLEIERNWAAGRSSIVLGDWITAGFGHWMRFLGEDGAMEFMDPMPGAQRRLSVAQFDAAYDGWYVHVDAAAGPPLCGAGTAPQVA